MCVRMRVCVCMCVVCARACARARASMLAKDCRVVAMSVFIILVYDTLFTSHGVPPYVF